MQWLDSVEYKNYIGVDMFILAIAICTDSNVVYSLYTFYKVQLFWYLLVP